MISNTQRAKAQPHNYNTKTVEGLYVLLALGITKHWINLNKTVPSLAAGRDQASPPYPEPHDVSTTIYTMECRSWWMTLIHLI